MASAPQPFEAARVAEAYADAQALILALASSHRIDAYLDAVQEVVEARLESAADMEDFTNRLAYVLYGLALFGSGALGVAEEVGGFEQQEVLARIGKALDQWLP